MIDAARFAKAERALDRIKELKKQAFTPGATIRAQREMLPKMIEQSGIILDIQEEIEQACKSGAITDTTSYYVDDRLLVLSDDAAEIIALLSEICGREDIKEDSVFIGYLDFGGVVEFGSPRHGGISMRLEQSNGDLALVEETTRASPMRYALQEGFNNVGRRPNNAITTPPEKQAVSRLHATIFVREGLVLVYDLGSTYGTKVRNLFQASAAGATSVRATGGQPARAEAKDEGEVEKTRAEPASSGSKRRRGWPSSGRRRKRRCHF